VGTATSAHIHGCRIDRAAAWETARRFATYAKVSGSAAYYSGLFADVGVSFLLHMIVEKSIDTPPEPECVLDFVRTLHEPIGATLLTQ
jgi:hypothetical protein